MATNIVIPADQLTDVWGLRPVAGGMWTAGAYGAGAVASHNGSLWFSNKQTSEEPNVGDDWTLLIAAPWGPVIPFVAGIDAKATAPVTLVTYGGTLYACTVEHITTSTFDAGKWIALISASAGALLEVPGGWNAATNSPALASGVGTNGALYRVTTAGNTTLDGVTWWYPGDYAFFSVDRWVKLRGNTIKADDLSDASVAGKALATAPDVAAQRVALKIDGAVTVNDASATIAANTRTVAVIAISAARTLTMPAASGYADGETLIIYDESGSCGPSKAITLARAGSDTINGQTSAVIAEPYGGLLLRRVSATKWVASRLSDRIGLRSVSTGAYSYVLGDNGGAIHRTASTVMTDTLPVFPAGYVVSVKNGGTALLTITPSSGTISGKSSVVFPPGSGTTLVCDGANYVALGDLPQSVGRWLLRTLSVSGGAISDTSVFTLGFTKYVVELEDVVTTNDSETISVRLRSGGAYASTNYRNAGGLVNYSGYALLSASATQFYLTRVGGLSNAGRGLSGGFEIMRPQKAGAKTIKAWASYDITGNDEAVTNTGSWNSSAAADGFQVFAAAGIATGAAYVYGVS